jgi:hypothetical protein
MSITVSNWKQICDAPTNNSPSKMAYSFPKAPLTPSGKENKYAHSHVDPKFITILNQS